MNETEIQDVQQQTDKQEGGHPLCCGICFAVSFTLTKKIFTIFRKSVYVSHH